MSPCVQSGNKRQMPIKADRVPVEPTCYEARTQRRLFRQLLCQARSLSEHRQSRVGTHMTFNTRRLPNFNLLISESMVVETFNRAVLEISKRNLTKDLSPLLLQWLTPATAKSSGLAGHDDS